MRFYETHAFPLARQALDGLELVDMKDDITHLILTTCTGFYAPGLDIEIVEHYGLKPSVERTIVGFMGCYAGMNALKLARHIVRSDHAARVLIVNLELCSLHLQRTDNLEQMLSFLLFRRWLCRQHHLRRGEGYRIAEFLFRRDAGQRRPDNLGDRRQRF